MEGKLVCLVVDNYLELKKEADHYVILFTFFIKPK